MEWESDIPQNYFNCWESLKLFELQHNDLKGYKCECGESRKNQIDDIRLNPKCRATMGNQQPRLQSKAQRLFRKEVHPSGWKWVGTKRKGECVI